MFQLLLIWFYFVLAFNYHIFNVIYIKPFFYRDNIPFGIEQIMIIFFLCPHFSCIHYFLNIESLLLLLFLKMTVSYAF